MLVQQTAHPQQAVAPQGQRHIHVLATGAVLGVKEVAQGGVSWVQVHALDHKSAPDD
jgi:hypothetical protein